MSRPPVLMLLPPMIFIGLVAVFAIGMLRNDPDALPSARVNLPAPPVRLTPLSGKTVFNDQSLRQGQVTVVNFWASWCAPCRAEHASLAALSEAGVVVYGVNYKDTAEKALGFLAELGDPYRALGADETGKMGLDWGLYGVPETYIIGRDGAVLKRFAGPITQRALEAEIRPVLDAAHGE
jgi:cytochrome c biogenesis protein CcmG/thiol:disulfide interchange protein DsbE